MAITVQMDGSNVAEKVVEGSVSHELNGRSTATVKMPIDVASGDDGSTLYVSAAGEVEGFYGEVQHVDEQADEDEGFVVYTAVDPSFILDYRPARDADGDFSKPSFMTDFPTGPQMLEEILTNSITYEGALGFSLGTFATGGVDLSGLPTDWPMPISEIMGLLTQTGEVDVVMSFASTGATLSAYNGNWGTDRTGSVSFQFAMGTASNCRGCRRTIDSSQLMNKLWLYLGPRVGTSADPPGDQHWRGNITKDHSELAGIAGFATIDSLITASRASRRQRMEVRILDEDYTSAHVLYLHWWLRESLLRARAKTMVHLTPHRGIAPAFGVGDLISVQAGTSFRGGFSGVQRVYSYTYRWDTEGVIELGEPVGQAGAPALVVSSDQEALA